MISKAVSNSPGAPGLGVKAHGGVMTPLHHRPFNQAGLGQHQALRAGCVSDTGLNAGVKLSPGRALAVQQLLPAQGIFPGGQSVRRYAGLFEVVKAVRQALTGQPGAGFFDRVAVGYAVQNDHDLILPLVTGACATMRA